MKSGSGHTSYREGHSTTDPIHIKAVTFWKINNQYPTSLRGVNDVEKLVDPDVGAV